jgi:hypothetical protein
VTDASVYINRQQSVSGSSTILVAPKSFKCVFASSKLATPVAAVADRPVQCERPEPLLFGRATDRTSRILETGNARLWSADDNPLMAFTFLRGCLLRAR